MISIENVSYVTLSNLLSEFSPSEVDEVYEIMDEFFTWGDTDIVLVNKKEIIHVLEQNIDNELLLNSIKAIPTEVFVRIN